MAEKLCKFAEKHKDILLYLFFGALTTLVNFLVYLPLHRFAGLSATLSNIAAWVVAVVFAFLTNKPFVFQSNDWSAGVAFPEFLKFVGCRLGSGLTETVILALTVDLLGWNGIIMKVVTAVIVVILNYIGSKLLVFGKNERK